MKLFLLLVLLVLAGTEIVADVSHLDTNLQEDGYHYKQPSVPFPTPPSDNDIDDGGYERKPQPQQKNYVPLISRPPTPRPQPQPQLRPLPGPKPMEPTSQPGHEYLPPNQQPTSPPQLPTEPLPQLRPRPGAGGATTPQVPQSEYGTSMKTHPATRAEPRPQPQPQSGLTFPGGKDNTEREYLPPSGDNEVTPSLAAARPSYPSPETTYLGPQTTQASPQPTYPTSQPIYLAPQSTHPALQPTYPQPTYPARQPTYPSQPQPQTLPNYLEAGSLGPDGYNYNKPVNPFTY